jgi:hypothetical protein
VRALLSVTRLLPFNIQSLKKCDIYCAPVGRSTVSTDAFCRRLSRCRRSLADTSQPTCDARALAFIPHPLRITPLPRPSNTLLAANRRRSVTDAHPPPTPPTPPTPCPASYDSQLRPPLPLRLQAAATPSQRPDTYWLHSQHTASAGRQFSRQYIHRRKLGQAGPHRHPRCSSRKWRENRGEIHAAWRSLSRANQQQGTSRQDAHRRHRSLPSNARPVVPNGLAGAALNTHLRFQSSSSHSPSAPRPRRRPSPVSALPSRCCRHKVVLSGEALACRSL